MTNLYFISYLLVVICVFDVKGVHYKAYYKDHSMKTIISPIMTIFSVRISKYLYTPHTQTYQTTRLTIPHPQPTDIAHLFMGGSDHIYSKMLSIKSTSSKRAIYCAYFSLIIFLDIDGVFRRRG